VRGELAGEQLDHQDDPAVIQLVSTDQARGDHGRAGRDGDGVGQADELAQPAPDVGEIVGDLSGPASAGSVGAIGQPAGGATV
jgi:hypothetical protein